MGTENNAEQDAKFWSPQIPPLHTPAWRYIDLTQLMSILERESLWFNRADEFADPLEGSLSRANVKTRDLRYQNTDIPESALNALSQSMRLHRKTAYVNCWHLNEYESAAMWEQYSTNGQGIAIQTTVGQFIESLTDKDGFFISGEETPDEPDKIEQIFTCGRVKYIDYDQHLIPENNSFAPIFHKRLSFKHEQEFRVAFSIFGDKLDEWDGVEGVNESEIETPSGMYIGVNLDDLIDTLYISPTAPDWFSELVGLVSDRYELNCKIQRSSIDEDPVF